MPPAPRRTTISYGPRRAPAARGMGDLLRLLWDHRDRVEEPVLVRGAGLHEQRKDPVFDLPVRHDEHALPFGELELLSGHGPELDLLRIHLVDGVAQRPLEQLGDLLP